MTPTLGVLWVSVDLLRMATMRWGELNRPGAARTVQVAKHTLGSNEYIPAADCRVPSGCRLSAMLHKR